MIRQSNLKEILFKSEKAYILHEGKESSPILIKLEADFGKDKNQVFFIRTINMKLRVLPGRIKYFVRLYRS